MSGPCNIGSGVVGGASGWWRGVEESGRSRRSRRGRGSGVCVSAEKSLSRG